MIPQTCLNKVPQPYSPMHKKQAFLYSLPMFLITALLLLHNFPAAPTAQAALMITYVFVNTLFFLMLSTGKTHRYRSLFFVIASACFVFSFITNLIEVRGSMELTAAHMIEGAAPLCPLVIPMLIIPAVFTKTIIFPGSMFANFAGIAEMIILWLGITIAIGRGWCSWVCFFGGMDEGFSKLCKKPRLTIATKWTYLPHAVLLTIVLFSALTLSPTYCMWLCPFKTVTEFPEVNSAAAVLQAIIFVTLFVALVIILPIMTGRRTQCGLFCPFASFQSFTNKCNIFTVTIDTNRCVHCNHCVKTCPTFSLSEESTHSGKPLLSCTKCGKCIDACPQQAISYHIKGTALQCSSRSHRLLFLYPAYICGAVIGGGGIIDTLNKLLSLLLTGKLFY